MSRIEFSFLALVAVQAAHSVEEYVGRLYDVFPPARFVSSLFSPNLQRGFLIFNVSLVAFGMWCFLWPLRRHWPSAPAMAWLWVGIETVNGIGHPLWSLTQRAYTPGVATAPALFVVALILARQLRARSAQAAAA
jgi:hypothetical protein